MKLNVVSSEHNVCYCLFIFHCCHSHRSGLHGLCKDRKWKKRPAFVLPVVQKLSEDPYGVFCLVLTPTRFTI